MVGQLCECQRVPTNRQVATDTGRVNHVRRGYSTRKAKITQVSAKLSLIPQNVPKSHCRAIEKKEKSASTM
jgi:hypothetical protein